MDLFERAAAQDTSRTPLAERMRPRTLDEVVGQSSLTAPGCFLRAVVDSGRAPSMVFWGPPGTGKTTLAQVVAASTGAELIALSAVLAGVADLRAAVASARDRWSLQRRRTLLFIDEIHRFNRAQQDALLPHVENGTVTLLGATTENPSFEVNAALLSRARVVVLEALDEPSIARLLDRAVTAPQGLDGKVQLSPEARATIVRASSGDARRALTTLEVAASLAPPGGAIDEALARQALQAPTLRHDSTGDDHFDTISAFIKSLRGSDPDAAVYWMTRMLEAGETPRFLLRRMVIFASEDIGNAEPEALRVAVAAFQAHELVGMPEASLTLTQAATFLALCPKSNAALTTYAAARKDVRDHGALPVPLHLRNAPTALAQKLGHGREYRYPHDFDGAYVPAEHLPDALRGRRYYAPRGEGREAQLKGRLEALLQAREAGAESAKHADATGKQALHDALVEMRRK